MMSRDDAIEHFGSAEEADRQNERVRVLMKAIVCACDGYALDHIVNATLILGLASMRADGSDIECAHNFVRHAWESPAVADLAAVLAEIEVSSRPDVQ